MSSAPSNPRPQPPQQERIIFYDCGGCGEDVKVRAGDKIECPTCNYPVYSRSEPVELWSFRHVERVNSQDV